MDLVFCFIGHFTAYFEAGIGEIHGCLPMSANSPFEAVILSERPKGLVPGRAQAKDPEFARERDVGRQCAKQPDHAILPHPIPPTLKLPVGRLLEQVISPCALPWCDYFGFV